MKSTKTLIVAHPDDECLWFNLEEFNKIIIVFRRGYREEERQRALDNHPLKDKIECWDFVESNYWRDKTKLAQYEDNYRHLCERLKTLDVEEVWTHNAYGEYGHTDHILVHNACMATLKCKVNGKDPILYNKIKECYEREGAWTWY
jgi:LmbE family N-acetylglucosaminyl deacetylase